MTQEIQFLFTDRFFSLSIHLFTGNKILFDSRTFTRPKKKVLNQISETQTLDCYKINEMSLESGVSRFSENFSVLSKFHSSFLY